MSFFAALTCQHGHRHESEQCDRADCRVCCTDLRECDVAKFARHQRAHCQHAIAEVCTSDLPVIAIRTFAALAHLVDVWRAADDAIRDAVVEAIRKARDVLESDVHGKRVHELIGSLVTDNEREVLERQLRGAA